MFIPLIKPSNNFLYNKLKIFLFTEGILVKELWIFSKLLTSSGNHSKTDVTVSNGDGSLSIQLFNNWITNNLYWEPVCLSSGHSKQRNPCANFAEIHSIMKKFAKFQHLSNTYTIYHVYSYVLGYKSQNVSLMIGTYWQEQ